MRKNITELLYNKLYSKKNLNIFITQNIVNKNIYIKNLY